MIKILDRGNAGCVWGGGVGEAGCGGAAAQRGGKAPRGKSIGKAQR